MKTITVTEDAVAENMGRKDLTGYMFDVAENGHKPGVLSGANLAGKARKYGASYARTRQKVFYAVRTATNGKVTTGKVLINSRWSRVWVDSATNEPVVLNVTLA